MVEICAEVQRFMRVGFNFRTAVLKLLGGWIDRLYRPSAETATGDVFAAFSSGDISGFVKCTDAAEGQMFAIGCERELVRYRRLTVLCGRCDHLVGPTVGKRRTKPR